MQQLLKPKEQQRLEAWAPPKPTLIDGIRTILDVEATTLTTETFKNSMQRCFIAVGLAPNADHGFSKYKEVKFGSISTLHRAVDDAEKRDLSTFAIAETMGIEMVKPPTSEGAKEADSEGLGVGGLHADDEQGEEGAASDEEGE